MRCNRNAAVFDFLWNIFKHLPPEENGINGAKPVHLFFKPFNTQLSRFHGPPSKDFVAELSARTCVFGGRYFALLVIKEPAIYTDVKKKRLI